MIEKHTRKEHFFLRYFAHLFCSLFIFPFSNFEFTRARACSRFRYFCSHYAQTIFGWTVRARARCVFAGSIGKPNKQQKRKKKFGLNIKYSFLPSKVIFFTLRFFCCVFESVCANRPNKPSGCVPSDLFRFMVVCL